MTNPDFQIFEAVGALVVVLDGEGRVLYWNRACRDLCGYSLDEVRGRAFWDFLLVAEEVEPVKASFARLFASDVPSEFANHWVTKSGERRWIAWSNTLTKAPDGRIQYIIKTGIDRTERKRAEDALRTSEARLRGVIGMASDAIISVDDQHRIVIYNQGAESIFGWSAAEVMGKPLDILLPERFRPVHAQHIAGFGSGHATAGRMGSSRSAISGLRKSGEEFPAQAAISKLDLVDGGRLFTVVLRDVTEEKRQEKEREVLAEAGEVFSATLNQDEMLASIARLAVQNLADCCIIDLVDEDGRLRRTTVLHRDPAKTALCKALQRIPDDRRLSVAPVASVLQSREPLLMAELSPQDVESMAESEQHLRAMRELGPRSLIAAPLSAHSEVLGALVLISTDRWRRYGHEDLRLAMELAHRSALALENVRFCNEARRAIYDMREANEQMVSATIRAQELMEEAEAAKARAEQSEHDLREVAEFREMFIGIVGHDLRNPLAAINLAANSLLRHDHVDQHGKELAGRIVHSGDRMSRMISQLLDLTRTRLGAGIPLERKPTDLRALCRTVIEEFDASIELEGEGDVTGTWDPDRLAEVLSNIMGNAIQHGAPGTAVLVRADAKGDEVVVEITNQGDPIPADLLPIIFEPFRRAKQNVKSPTGSLGLGLYIARQIALAEAGTLEARSGGGTTTFVLRLPRQGGTALPRDDVPATQPDRRGDRSDRRIGERRHL